MKITVRTKLYEYICEDTNYMKISVGGHNYMKISVGTQSANKGSGGGGAP